LPRASSLPAARGLMLLMFFLSGVAALIYQIVWTKELALVFGVTIYASSAVVTTFMAGLALGSVYFGRLADRWGRPLALFALLEAGIAAFALCFPTIVHAIKPVYATFYGPLMGNHYAMSLVRFVLSFAVLIVPTSLMGGTLPAISRAYVSESGALGRQVAGLYSANNVGAFVGCVAAGYALLELLGKSGTLMAAALLNLLVAAAAAWLATTAVGGRPRAEASEESPQEAEGSAGPASRAVRVALWVFAIEGVTSLVYQMAWMRMLILFVETNIYAVTAIVATFLGGLSLGAFVVRRWIDRTRDPYRLLGVIELGIALSAVVTIPAMPWLFRLCTGLAQAVWGWGWGGWTLARFTVAFLVILVPTSFMGATMPVASRIYLPVLRSVGRKMGLIGCLDTVGSIVGAFAGGFVLIPLLGIQRTIIASALVNSALALWMFAEDPVPAREVVRRRAVWLSGAVLVGVAGMLALRPIPLIYFSAVVREIPHGKLLDYHEDVESTVSVIEELGFARDLIVDHAGVAQTTRYDRPGHEVIAHLPLLLHPDPKRALLIGFGAGFTAAACRAHGVEVDAVELSAGVRRMAPWFAPYNGDILKDPAVHLIIDDGRNYVLGTRRRYDMIQAGIIHPAVNSGNSSFYTTDFYRECKRILAPGGIMCQWLPLHGMRHEDFLMLIRSFLEVFPNASVWFKWTPEFCVLIGTPEPLEIDFKDFERRVNSPAVRRHLASCGIVDAYDLLDSFCCAGEDLRQAVGPGPLHTDDHPYVEFHSNRPFPALEFADNIRFLGRIRRRVLPRLVDLPPSRARQVRARLERWFRGTELLISAGHAWVVMESIGPGAPDFERVAAQIDELYSRVQQVNPDDRNAAFLWRNSRARYHLLLGKWALRGGDRQEALRHLRMAAAEGAKLLRSAAEADYLCRVLAGPPRP